MPTINASNTGNTDDVFLSRFAESSWANARDATSANDSSDSAASSSWFTRSYHTVNPRTGATVYGVRRSFMAFDTSSITANVAEAFLSVRGVSTNDGSVIAVKSDAYGGDGGSNWGTSDFNNIVGWSAGSSLDGLATVYGAAKTTTNWVTNNWNEFTATGDLLRDMKNNDIVIVCLMNYTNDYLNVEPSEGDDLRCGGYYGEHTYRPHIDYTLGYNNKANGVTATSISKVSGVASTSIQKVNGV